MGKEQFGYQFEVLIKEWDYVQSHIGRFDSIIIVIRGWAVSVFAALLAVSVRDDLPLLMLLSVLVVLLFWFMDALFKTFQRTFILRGRVIENYLSSPSFLEDAEKGQINGIEIATLSSGFRKGSTWERYKMVLRSCLIRNVIMNYFGMLIISIICFLVLR